MSNGSTAAPAPARTCRSTAPWIDLRRIRPRRAVVARVGEQNRGSSAPRDLPIDNLVVRLAAAQRHQDDFVGSGPSFRGPSDAREPGIHEHGTPEYGFRVRSCAAPRNDNWGQAGTSVGPPRVIFNTFERMVAFRYLRARRQEGFVSVIAIFSLLGIALGVATLIIFMSVMNGFREDLVGRILGFNGHLGVYGEAGPLTDYDAIAAKVRAVPGIVSATPLIEGQVMATSDRGAAGALVRGIRPDDLRSRKLVAEHILGGSLADFGDEGVAVGERLARRLGVAVGGKVTLISPEGNDTAFGTIPRLKTYTVAALFSVGFYEYDNSFIYVPLPAAQIFFRMPNAVSDLEVFVANADDAAREGRLIAAALGNHVRILDWQHANSSLVNAVEIERNVMFLILTLIIVVAAFNIISGMIMMVKDRAATSPSCARWAPRAA